MLTQCERGRSENLGAVTSEEEGASLTDWKQEKGKPLSKVTCELDEHIMLSCSGNLSGECKLLQNCPGSFPRAAGMTLNGKPACAME